MEIITSRANPLIMRMAKLKDKSAREAERLFAVEGVKLFEEMLQAGLLPAYAFATEDNRACLDALPASVPAYLVSESVYEKISSEKAPQGIFVRWNILTNSIKGIQYIVAARLFPRRRSSVSAKFRTPAISAPSCARCAPLAAVR